MKNWIIVIVWVLVLNIQAQEIPKWYLNDIASEVGVWVTDNSQYISTQEPSDHYAIEWEIGPTKTILTGRLYGLKEGKEIGSFWSFKKYWDLEKGVAILEQTATDGTKGVGPYSVTGDYSSELIQVFTRPDGSSWTAGHRTVYLSAFRHIGNSFTIEKNGEWKPERTYTWIKQSPNLDHQPLIPLEYMIGQWHATPADSSFRSVMTYRFSENKNLLLATNQLFDKEGNEIGTFEGAYYAHDGQLGYYLAGPDGEIHIGQFEPKSNQIIHSATVSPGDKTNTYKSIMEFKLGKLYYHTKYSNNEVVPQHIPYNNPLIYLRLDKDVKN